MQKENKAQQEQLEALHRYIDTLAELYWAAQRIVDEENPLGTLAQCLYDVMHVIGAKDGSLSLLDQESGELVFAIVHGQLHKQSTGHRIKSDVGIVGWVMENREPVIVNNPRQDWRFFWDVDQEFSFQTHSIVCVPVMQKGEPVGVVELVNKEHQGFTKSDVTMLSILSHIAATALESTPLAFRSIKISPPVEDKLNEFGL